MKRLLLSAAVLCLSGSAYAATTGFYTGIEGGYADTGFTKEFSKADVNGANVGASASSSSSDIAGRLFAGYNFNPYVGLEMGYTKYSNTDIKGSATANQIFAGFDGPHMNTIYADQTFSEKGTIKEQSVDLVAKVMYPIEDTGINLYAKAGAVYMDAEADVSDAYTFSNATATDNVTGVTYTPATPAGTYAKASVSDHEFLPVFGAGASYDIDKNVAINIGYTRIEGNSNIPSVNFGSLGIAYNFG